MFKISHAWGQHDCVQSVLGTGRFQLENEKRTKEIEHAEGRHTKTTWQMEANGSHLCRSQALEAQMGPFECEAVTGTQQQPKATENSPILSVAEAGISLFLTASRLPNGQGCNLIISYKWQPAERDQANMSSHLSHICHYCSAPAQALALTCCASTEIKIQPSKPWALERTNAAVLILHSTDRVLSL